MIRFVRWIRRIFYYYVDDLPMLYKLLISHIVIIFIPMLLLSLLVYTRVDKVLEDQLKYSASQNFSQTEMAIENTLSRYDDLLLSISKSDLFYKLENRSGNDYSYNEKVRDRIALDTMEDSFIGTKSCTVRNYFDDSFDYFTNGQNYLNYSQVEHQKWFCTFVGLFNKENQMMYVCPPSYLPENSTNSVKIISITRAIPNPNNYEQYIGLLRIDFSESDIQDILDQSNAFKGSFTYLVNDSNTLISANINYKNEGKKPPDLLKNNSDINSSGWSDITINGLDYFGKIDSISRYNLNLVTLIPRQGILEECANIRNMIILLLIILSMIASCFAYWVSSFMNRRIQLLTQTMNRVKDGKLLLIHTCTGKDEIGMLIDNYNYMIKEMDQLIKITYKNGQELKNYELKVLQAQINPHFLYNTLDMINWFAGENKNDQIRTAVQAIAKFYKLSLSSGKDAISIRDELSHVSAYMQLQNMRYVDKLHFTVQVPEEIKAYEILKMTLQPIVENCIFHGIMERPSKEGNITINARREEGDIIITVADDGVGMTEEQILKIQSGTVQSKYGSGFGILNVDARLKGYYGPQYGLLYHSKYGVGMSVDIRIPAKLPEE